MNVFACAGRVQEMEKRQAADTVRTVQDVELFVTRSGDERVDEEQRVERVQGKSRERKRSQQGSDFTSEAATDQQRGQSRCRRQQVRRCAAVSVVVSSSPASPLSRHCLFFVLAVSLVLLLFLLEVS